MRGFWRGNKYMLDKQSFMIEGMILLHLSVPLLLISLLIPSFPSFSFSFLTDLLFVMSLLEYYSVFPSLLCPDLFLCHTLHVCVSWVLQAIQVSHALLFDREDEPFQSQSNDPCPECFSGFSSHLISLSLAFMTLVSCMTDFEMAMINKTDGTIVIFDASSNTSRLLVTNTTMVMQLHLLWTVHFRSWDSKSIFYSSMSWIITHSLSHLVLCFYRDNTM